MTKEEERKMALFRRLDLAAVSFRESKALAEHLIQLGIVPASNAATLYSACCCGIVTTYARPFMGAEGLGPINKSEYGQGFESAEMQRMHDELLGIRNQVYAHRDLEAAKSVTLHPESNSSAVFESHIVISKSASGNGARIFSEPSLLYLHNENLPQIAALCDFQVKRTSVAAAALLTHLAQGKSYAPGRYTLGIDFP